ncbi:hypothetical protein [Nocardia salmonicida]|uniref:hypothetical protein n=1 Tax=Nocardia salmonicida TaxID=53431 RepID=UPI0033EF0119
MVTMIAPQRIGDEEIAVKVTPGEMTLVEAERVATYLENCTPLVVSPGVVDDPFLGEGCGYLRVGEFTDGEWFWSLTWADYVRVHRAAPPTEFLDHIKKNDYTPPVVTDEEVDRICTLLYGSDYSGPEDDYVLPDWPSTRKKS